MDSFDVDELVEVKEEQSNPAKRIFLGQASLLNEGGVRLFQGEYFSGLRIALQGEFKAKPNGGLRIWSGLVGKPCGEEGGVFVHERGVQHPERLCGHGANEPHGAWCIRRRLIVFSEQGEGEASFDVNINGPARGLRSGLLGPAATWNRLCLEDFFRKRRMNRRAVEFEAKGSCHGQNGIADFFSGQAAHGEASEEQVIGVFCVMLRESSGSALIRVRAHDETMHRFVAASVFQECVREPIE